MQIITDVIAFFSISLRFIADLANFFTSSQRIHRYCTLDSEDDLVKETDYALMGQEQLTLKASPKVNEIKDLWPREGEIIFQNVKMKYRDTLEPSLKDLDLLIQPRWKVGIVGRTGAGKSSILQAIFRLVELSEGQIFIDNVDIKSLGLHILRKGIAYIPQSPFLL